MHYVELPSCNTILIVLLFSCLVLSFVHRFPSFPLWSVSSATNWPVPVPGTSGSMLCATEPLNSDTLAQGYAMCMLQCSLCGFTSIYCYFFRIVDICLLCMFALTSMHVCCTCLGVGAAMLSASVSQMDRQQF